MFLHVNYRNYSKFSDAKNNYYIVSETLATEINLFRPRFSPISENIGTNNNNNFISSQ